MAKYKTSIITSKGQELMAKATSGEAKIEFTKAVFGSGEWSDEDISPNIIELKEQKQSVSISSMKVSSEQKNVVNLSAVLSNDNLKEGYFINEIGLYARDKNAENSEEILYFIIIAEKGYADYFPASSYSPVKILQDFYIEVADSSDTAIAIDNKVAVTLPYLKENYYDKRYIDNAIETNKQYAEEYCAQYSAQYSRFECNLEPKEKGIKLFVSDGSLSEETVVYDYINTKNTSDKIISFVDDTIILRTVYGSSEPYQILYCLKSQKLYHRIARYVGGHGAGHYAFDDWEEVIYG